MVRSILGYATQVWSPQTDLERIQMRATDEDRLTSLDLIPITYIVMSTLTLCFSLEQLKGIGMQQKNLCSFERAFKTTNNAFYRFFYIKLHSKDISAETHDQSAILDFQEYACLRHKWDHATFDY